jgi:hypothetical protein
VVRDITVTFDSLVSFAGDPAAAFRLTRIGPGDPVGDVTLTVDLSGSTATRTVAKLTFSGSYTEYGGSLINGNYVLKIFGSQITDALGRALDGDHDGVAGGDGDAALFRLLGDTQGDRFVDTLDLHTFYSAYGSRYGDPNYLWYCDFDASGNVDTSDLFKFYAAFGIPLPPP